LAVPSLCKVPHRAFKALQSGEHGQRNDFGERQPLYDLVAKSLM
jgi:hypothetical protein